MFEGLEEYHHRTQPTIGILLVNLGTPEAPTSRSVRHYLAEFLSDRRVVEYPRWLWRMILWGIILPIRSKRSAKAYASIWSDEGSPLLKYSIRLKEALQNELDKTSVGVNVALAMRYGKPGVASVISKMQQQGVQKLLVLPLYPQYSSTTTGAVMDAITSKFQRTRWIPDFRFVSHYHDDPGYIKALSQSIRQFWERHGKGNILIISFHGIPYRYVEQGDPYFCHCHKTARLVALELGLEENEWLMAFQSRFGRERWLAPSVDEELETLNKQGIRVADIVCPGFAVDCLETLEEVAIGYRNSFNARGGELRYIPSLNDCSEHVEALANKIISCIADWCNLPALSPEELNRREQMAADAVL